MMIELRIATIVAGLGFLLSGDPLANAQSSEPVVIPFDEVPLVYTIAGTVVDSKGDAIRNATVLLATSTEDGRIFRTARSDRFGRYSFADLPESRYSYLKAFHERHAVPSVKGGRVSVDLPRPADAPPVVLTLVEARSYHGAVLDIDGTPAAGALVRPMYDHEQFGGERDTQEYETRTDEEGRFTFTQLALARPGFWIWYKDRPILYSDPDHMPADGVYRLTEGMTMIGCVRNEQGEHLEGVSLQAPGGSVGGGQGVHYGPWFTSSAEDGSFRIEGIVFFPFMTREQRFPTHAYSVVVDDSRFKADRYGLYMTPENTLPFVEIVVRDAAAPGDAKRISIGKVISTGAATVTVRLPVPPPPDTEGPLSGITLVNVPGDTPRYREREFFRGAESVTFYDVLPGAYTVSANVSGMAFEPQNIRLAPFDEVEVLLERGPAILTGTVSGLKPGDPRPTIHWWISPEGRSLSRSSGSTVVTAENTYTVEGLPAGEGGIQVSVDKVWRQPETIEIKPGENRHDLALPQASIEGRVLDFGPDNRNPHREDIVIESKEIHWRLELNADDDGTFRADFLPPGAYTVTYRYWKKRNVKAEVEVLLADGERVYVELEVPKDLGMIAGTVIGMETLDFDSQYRDDDVSILAKHEEKPQDYNYGDIEVKTGAFEIQNLAPGSYLVTVHSDGIWGRRKGVEVQPNSRTIVDIELMELRKVTLRLVSTTSFKPGRIEYEIVNIDDDTLKTSLSMGGGGGGGEPGVDTEQTHALPPGSYVLTATFGSDDPIVLPFDLPPGSEPLRLEVRRD